MRTISGRKLNLSKGQIERDGNLNTKKGILSMNEMLTLSDKEYNELAGVNWHSLQHMSISPEQYIYELKKHRDPTVSQGLGTAEHAAMLEPDKFFERKLIVKTSRKTKKFIEIVNENPSSYVITQDEYDMILTHLEKFRQNEFYDFIMRNARIEQTIQWKNANTGLVCKGRPDLFNDDVLMDIKTSAQIEDEKWWWDFRRYKYHAQFAYYLDALEIIDGKDRRVICVKLETSPVFDVVYYPIPWDAIIAGRDHYERLLSELRDCIDANCWPGKSNELAPVRFSNWKIEREY